MIIFPSRFGALALVLSAGLLPLANVRAQTTDEKPADLKTADQMVHTDAGDRHLAPHDTFYTLGYDSVRTDKGVDGFPPGTEVKLVSVNRDAHTLTVTDGHANVELPPDKLTNDLDIAAAVKARDQTRQAQVIAYQQAEAKRFQDYEKAVADYTNKDLAKREKAIQAENKAESESSGSTDNSQPVPTSYSNGYYNEGGYGYGSPFGYFVGLTETNANGGGKGSNPTATTGAQGVSRSVGTNTTGRSTGTGTGGTSTGTAGSGGAAGGKH